VQIVGRAIEEPMRWIAQNAGWEGAVVLEKVRSGKGAYGFNPARGTSVPANSEY
jgi:chaperonin GroEL